jgi:hypothetical protein
MQHMSQRTSMASMSALSRGGSHITTLEPGRAAHTSLASSGVITGAEAAAVVRPNTPDGPAGSVRNRVSEAVIVMNSTTARVVVS